jgi:hypothetical protein
VDELEIDWQRGLRAGTASHAEGTDREDWDHDLVTAAGHISVSLAADDADAEGHGYVTKDDYPDQGK